MSATKPTLDWIRINGRPHLRFVFKAALTEEDCQAAIAEWRQAFEERSEEVISLVWEASEMKSYESKARKFWQEAMREMRDRIGTVWLVTGSSIIRMGASVMSLFSSIDIKVVSSQDEIGKRLPG